MSSLETKRVSAIDAVKGLAIFGVLFAHAGDSTAFGGVLAPLQVTFGWCVTVFFGLAGVLEAMSSKNEKFVDYANHRAVRLGVPFIVLHLLFNIISAVLMKQGIIQDGVLVDQSWISLLLVLHAPQLYFLPWLWMVGVILWRPLRATPTVVAVVLAVGVVVIKLSFPPRTYGYGAHLENIPVYLAAFAIGFTSVRSRILWPVIICIVGGVIEISRNGAYHSLHPVVAPLLLAAIGRRAWKPLKLLSFVGTWSFAIYLWHVPLVMPAVRRMLVFPMHDGVRLVIVLTLTIALCIGWGLLLTRNRLLRFFAR